MDKVPHPMKFARMLGLLEGETKYRIPKEMLNQVLNFKYLHERAHAISLETADKLFATYGHHRFSDFGDEPIISQAHNDINVIILDEVEKRYPKFQARYTQLFERVCDFTESLVFEGTDRLAKARELMALIGETQKLLMVSLVNGEIVDAVFNHHFLRFGRPSIHQLWEMAAPRSERFKDFFLHSALIGTAKHLKFLTTDLRERWGLVGQTVNPQEQKPGKAEAYNFGVTEAERLSTGSGDRIVIDGGFDRCLGPVNPDRGQLIDLFDQIGMDIKNQGRLIGCYQIFIASFASGLPVRYSSENHYRTLYENYVQAPAQNRKEYFNKLYLNSMVIDHADPDEFEVAHLTDLILIYIHTFLAISNIFALGMSFYLYVQYLFMDPEFAGLIQALYPFGALVFGFIWNEWTRQRSFKWPFLLSILMGVVSNFLYYIAQTTVELSERNDPNAALAGRSPNPRGIVLLCIALFLMGAGSARPMILKYLYISVKPWAATRYFTYYTAATFTAICVGPGIQSFVFLGEFGKNHCRQIAGSQMCTHNILAFIFMLAWCLLFIVFLIFFSGYERKREEKRRNKKFGLVHTFYALNQYGFRSPVITSTETAPRGVSRSQIFAKLREDGLVKQPTLGHTPRGPAVHVNLFNELMRKYETQGYANGAHHGPVEVAIDDHGLRREVVSSDYDGPLPDLQPTDYFVDDWRTTIHYKIHKPLRALILTTFITFIINVP